MWIEYAHVGLAAVFATAAVACFFAATRDVQLKHADSRLGLRVLLVTVGLWGAIQAVQMLAPTAVTARSLYLLGLIVGFGTVWAWLFFASAYTGHSFHRHRPYQAGALTLYLVLIAIKLTNPIHHQYMRAEFVTTPYPRLVVTQQPIYWLSFSLAYGFTAIGLYLLIQTFRRSPHSERTLIGLVLVTALSAIPKILNGLAPGLIPELSYEPLGVAVFALGALYVAEDAFVNLEAPTQKQLFDSTTDGVIAVDAAGRIREYNDRATALFPDLETSITTVDDLFSRLSVDTPTDGPAEQTVLATYTAADDPRTYLLTINRLDVGPHQTGSTVFIQDITNSRRRREELSRHNEQLEAIADGIAHELRNALGITGGYLELADSTATDAAMYEPIPTARRSVERAQEIVDDLHVLTRYAQSIEALEPVSLQTALESADQATDTALSFHLERPVKIHAEPTRLHHLLTNAIRFAVYADATTLSVSVDGDRLSFTDDGVYDSASFDESVFSYDAAVPTADAGLRLPNVRSLARVHGWTVSLDPTFTGGMRYHIDGVRVAPSQSVST